MLMIFILVMKDMTYKCSHFSEFSSISAVTGDAMLLFGIYHRYTNFIRENFIRRNIQITAAHSQAKYFSFLLSIARMNSVNFINRLVLKLISRELLKH